MKSCNLPSKMRCVLVVSGPEWTITSACLKYPFLFFLLVSLLTGRFHPPWWRFIPWQQTFTPVPSQVPHYAAKILHGRLACTLRNPQWPESQLQHNTVSFTWCHPIEVLHVMSCAGRLRTVRHIGSDKWWRSHPITHIHLTYKLSLILMRNELCWLIDDVRDNVQRCVSIIII